MLIVYSNEVSRTKTAHKIFRVGMINEEAPHHIYLHFLNTALSMNRSDIRNNFRLFYMLRRQQEITLRGILKLNANGFDFIVIKRFNVQFYSSETCGL